METGTRSLRRAFRNGSCRDWPRAMCEAPCFLVSFGLPNHFPAAPGTYLFMLAQGTARRDIGRECKTALQQCSDDISRNFRVQGVKPPCALTPAQPGQLPLAKLPR